MRLSKQLGLLSLIVLTWIVSIRNFWQLIHKKNNELKVLAINMRVKGRAYWGVLSLEDVEKRRQLAENKKKEKEARSPAKKEKQDDW